MIVRQAIKTRYLGPTTHKGSRVVAKCYAKRIVIDWADNLNVDENHVLAAKELCNQLGWKGSLATGCVDDEYVHVFKEDEGLW